MKLREDDKKLIDALVQRGYLDRSFEIMVNQFIEKWNVRVFDMILETRIVDQKKLADLISESFGFERREQFEHMPAAVETVPRKFLQDWFCYFIPGQDSEDYIVVANPVDDNFHEALKKLDLKKVKIAVSELGTIKKILHENYLLSEVL